MEREKVLLLQYVRMALGTMPVSGEVLEGIDWSRISSLARAHGVSGLLYETFGNSALKGKIPSDLLVRLQRNYLLTARQNLSNLQVLFEILRNAARNQIQVMLLKGLVLVHDSYLSPATRIMSDMDLLVREEHFPAFRKILAALGYHTSLPKLSWRELPDYAHCYQQVRFRSQTGPRLEVHFRLLNFGLPSHEEPAWDDSVAFELYGTPAIRPSNERFLLHLCLHSAQHRFRALRQFADIVVWCRSMKPTPGTFVGLAQQNQVGTLAHYSLSYARDLLGLDEWQAATETLQPPGWKSKLLDWIWADSKVRTLRAPAVPLEAELPLAFLCSDASLPEKVAFAWRVLMPHESWMCPHSPPLQIHGRWEHWKDLALGLRRTLRNRARQDA